MLSALIGPMLVFITGIAVPLGIVLPRDTMSYPRMQALVQHWAGKGFVFLVVTLFLWHGAHRIFHSLHDLGIRTGGGAKMICYGLALLGTFATGYSLLTLGS